MVCALARELNADDVAAGVRVPRHRAGRLEASPTLGYANLLPVPDRRTQAGRPTTRCSVG